MCVSFLVYETSLSQQHKPLLTICAVSGSILALKKELVISLSISWVMRLGNISFRESWALLFFVFLVWCFFVWLGFFLPFSYLSAYYSSHLA